jgi:hypothetical protein
MAKGQVAEGEQLAGLSAARDRFFRASTSVAAAGARGQPRIDLRAGAGDHAHRTRARVHRAPCTAHRAPCT